jgi:ADP-glucose pyrophosphorylase
MGWVSDPVADETFYTHWNVGQVLAATQTAGESGKKWFQGTADAVRQFLWLFEVLLGSSLIYCYIFRRMLSFY